MTFDKKKAVMANCIVTTIHDTQACVRYGPKIDECRWVLARDLKIGDKVYLYKEKEYYHSYEAERIN